MVKKTEEQQSCCRKQKPTRLYILLGVLLLTCCLIFFSRESKAQGTWKKLSNVTGDYNYGVMLLLTDGTVMVKTSTGAGSGIYGNTWDQLTPDEYGSYINGSWNYLSPMTDTRLYFSSQVLPDGRVYVAGGEYGSGANTAEVYDPAMDSWTSAPALPHGDTMWDANSEILPDGRVLQALLKGGTGAWGTANLIYDPVTNTYTNGPSSTGLHEESTWIKLPDNSILFVDFFLRSSERYIPSLNKWIADSSLPVPIYDTVIGETGPAFLLPNGKAVFFGANGNTVYYTPSGSTAKGSWAAGPKIPYKRGTPDGCAAMMPNGKILISVSDTPSAINWFPSPTHFYEFNYLTDSFTEISSPVGVNDTLAGPCFDTHFLNLPDGNILFSFGTNAYYEYIPDSAPIAAGKPTVNRVLKIDCNTYMATGTLFNGITEGSVYGDDWQMSTNYPIIRLTNDTFVYYARTTNWNRVGAVMTGSLPDTTQFTLPDTLPGGTYALQIVVNGNPSASYSFTTCNVGIATVTATTDRTINVYPNPATGFTTVVFNADLAGQYHIKLLNVLGQVMKEETGEAISGNNTHLLNLNGMPQGVYTIIVQEASEVRNAKLVVE